ncbi:unnamed protein product [Amoebophrya sp. A25]|nr:unnamed protein product [Amoebophrya sp. A25]|eukprot:GSA25T00001690001.1
MTISHHYLTAHVLSNRSSYQCLREVLLRVASKAVKIGCCCCKVSTVSRSSPRNVIVFNNNLDGMNVIIFKYF